jgi:hypothetical protein
MSDLPTTDAHADGHDHILVLFSQLFMIPHQPAQIDVGDDGRVEQEERHLGVQDLHGIQLTESVPDGLGRGG